MSPFPCPQDPILLLQILSPGWSLPVCLVNQPKPTASSVRLQLQPAPDHPLQGLPAGRVPHSSPHRQEWFPYNSLWSTQVRAISPLSLSPIHAPFETCNPTNFLLQWVPLTLTHTLVYLEIIKRHCSYFSDNLAFKEATLIKSKFHLKYYDRSQNARIL